jgi:serine/threonine protein phosphatase PrpC
MDAMLRPVSAALSDSGRKRSHNEDSFFADDALGFYVVADGVGGHAKGEVASAEAVEQLQLWILRSQQEIAALYSDVSSGDPEAKWEIRRLLESGVQSACYMIFGMAELDPEKRGMSTTISALLVGPHSCYAAHVGDSRVYRIRAGEVLQMTEDHTLINYKLRHGLMTPEEAESAKGKNVITRAVGHKDHVQIDTADLDVAAGDRFLLCSDGLHGYIQDDAEVADLVGAGDLGTCVYAAIQLANHRGGKDNITAIAVEVVGEP